MPGHDNLKKNTNEKNPPATAERLMMTVPLIYQLLDSVASGRSA